ncbi:MAG TPA: hypothetical protein VMB34_28275 [Acetobacteraceae bacterium]|nr:hypothetical protein [Acetobacteraceae bacterium]
MGASSPSFSVSLPQMSVVGGIDAPIRDVRPCPAADPDAVVNRILDWCDQAHANRRDERVRHLLNLAWQAFDRLPV